MHDFNTCPSSSSAKIQMAQPSEDTPAPFPPNMTRKAAATHGSSLDCQGHVDAPQHLLSHPETCDETCCKPQPVKAGHSGPCRPDEGQDAEIAESDASTVYHVQPDEVPGPEDFGLQTLFGEDDFEDDGDAKPIQPSRQAQRAVLDAIAEEQRYIANCCSDRAGVNRINPKAARRVIGRELRRSLAYGLKVISNDPWAAEYEGYPERLSLIASARESVREKRRVLRCTYKKPCGRPRFCPRCAKAVQQEVVDQIGEAYVKRRYWTTITLSWSYDPDRGGLLWAVEKDEVGRVVRSVPLLRSYRNQPRREPLVIDVNSCKAHERLLRVILDVLGALERAGIVDGVYARHELDAKFWTARDGQSWATKVSGVGIIHVHATVCSDRPFTRRVAREMFRKLEDFARRAGVLDFAYPNVLVSKLESQKEFERWLRYSTKCAPLDTIYRRGLAKGTNVGELNRAFDEYLDALSCLASVPNGFRIGSLRFHPKPSKYIGTATPAQRQRQVRTAESRARGIERQIQAYRDMLGLDGESAEVACLDHAAPAGTSDTEEGKGPASRSRPAAGSKRVPVRRGSGVAKEALPGTGMVRRGEHSAKLNEDLSVAKKRLKAAKRELRLLVEQAEREERDAEEKYAEQKQRRKPRPPRLKKPTGRFAAGLDKRVAAASGKCRPPVTPSERTPIQKMKDVMAAIVAVPKESPGGLSAPGLETGCPMLGQSRAVLAGLGMQAAGKPAKAP